MEISEPEDNIPVGDNNAFEIRMHTEDSAQAKILYQRGYVLQSANSTGILLLNQSVQIPQGLTGFFSQYPAPKSPASEPKSLPRQEAIKSLERKGSKDILEGQNLTRHRVVLALLYLMESRHDDETREEFSYQVVRSFSK
jgi:hypothetical protein